ncbi:hypothetical protein EJB05_19490, partial [Eragrostis curvula]
MREPSLLVREAVAEHLELPKLMFLLLLAAKCTAREDLDCASITPCRERTARSMLWRGRQPKERNATPHGPHGGRGTFIILAEGSARAPDISWRLGVGGLQLCLSCQHELKSDAFATRPITLHRKRNIFAASTGSQPVSATYITFFSSEQPRVIHTHTPSGVVREVRIHRMDDLAALARGKEWTEERHAAYLDRMELSFVQQVVLGGSDVRQASRRLGRRALPQAASGGRAHVPLPLDRPLPDSAVESNRGAPSRPAAGSSQTARGK